jgi:hypothetical protein
MKTAVATLTETARYGPVPVPRLWPGETFVCLGSGPSLTQADVDACRGRARVIAIKNTVEMAPWADVLYGAGSDAGGNTWWSREGASLQFDGLRYTLDPQARNYASVLTLGPEGGLTSDPGQLAHGHHSGYQAINLAIHLGAARVVLLGYDMQQTDGKDHYFGKHPHEKRLPYALFMMWFPSIVPALEERGVSVVNASRETALDLFPRMNIYEALA